MCTEKFGTYGNKYNNIYFQNDISGVFRFIDDYIFYPIM